MLSNANTRHLALLGPIRAKTEIYALISALRVKHRELKSDVAMQIYCEDLLGPDHVGGEYELCQELATISANRELIVHAQDAVIGTVGLSLLAYASRRTANVPAMIGGFGDFHVIRDSSEFSENAGIAVKVVRAGQWKGVGTPGTLLTDEQIAEMGRPAIESTMLVFGMLNRVRNWTAQQAEDLLSGRVFLGPNLLRMDLVDSFSD